MQAIIPEPETGSAISAAVNSELSLCYTCGSCAAECPVNRATSRLQPLKLVRMAGYGMIEELLRTPEIWYCLSCNRCTNICPMTIKPAGLLAFLRKEAVRRGHVRSGTASSIEEIQKRFHKARHHAVTLLAEEKRFSGTDGLRGGVKQTPLPSVSTPAPIDLPSVDAARFRKAFRGFLGRQTNISSCYTCCECTNSCPVSRGDTLLDPMRIVRMVTLGLREELLASTSIWLCIGCQTCTSACGQLVRGHMVLRRAQELAIEGGFADAEFLEKWQEIQQELFISYVCDIDSHLSMNVLPEAAKRGGGVPDREYRG